MHCVTGVYLRDITGMIFVILRLKVESESSERLLFFFYFVIVTSLSMPFRPGGGGTFFLSLLLLLLLFPKVKNYQNPVPERTEKNTCMPSDTMG